MEIWRANILMVFLLTIDVSFGRQPWQVFLKYMGNNNKTYNCIGYVVSKHLILTTPTCNFQADKVEVYTECETSKQRTPIANSVEILSNRNTDKKTGSSNVGMLVVRKGLKLNEHLFPIELATKCPKHNDKVKFYDTECCETDIIGETHVKKVDENEPTRPLFTLYFTFNNHGKCDKTFIRGIALKNKNGSLVGIASNTKDETEFICFSKSSQDIREVTKKINGVMQKPANKLKNSGKQQTVLSNAKGNFSSDDTITIPKKPVSVVDLNLKSSNATILSQVPPIKSKRQASSNKQTTSDIPPNATKLLQKPLINSVKKNTFDISSMATMLSQVPPIKSNRQATSIKPTTSDISPTATKLLQKPLINSVNQTTSDISSNATNLSQNPLYKSNRQATSEISSNDTVISQATILPQKALNNSIKDTTSNISSNARMLSQLPLDYSFKQASSGISNAKMLPQMPFKKPIKHATFEISSNDTKLLNTIDEGAYPIEYIALSSISNISTVETTIFASHSFIDKMFRPVRTSKTIINDEVTRTRQEPRKDHFNLKMKRTPSSTTVITQGKPCIETMGRFLLLADSEMEERIMCLSEESPHFRRTEKINGLFSNSENEEISDPILRNEGSPQVPSNLATEKSESLPIFPMAFIIVSEEDLESQSDPNEN